MWISFKLLGHFLNSSRSNMIISKFISHISIIFMSRVFDRLVELNRSIDDSIISIFIDFSSFLTDGFNSLDESIIIPSGIEMENSLLSININNLFPMWRSTLSILFFCFKFKWEFPSKY